MGTPEKQQTSKPAQRGRPKLSNDVARGERVVTFVTEQQKQELDALADRQSTSLSLLLYQLIAKGLQTETRQTDSED